MDLEVMEMEVVLVEMAVGLVEMEEVVEVVALEMEEVVEVAAAEVVEAVVDLVLVAVEYPAPLHQRRNASPCPKPTVYLCPSNPVPTFLPRSALPVPSRSASMFHLLNLKENANQ